MDQPGKSNIVAFMTVRQTDQAGRTSYGRDSASFPMLTTIHLFILCKKILTQIIAHKTLRLNKTIKKKL